MDYYCLLHPNQGKPIPSRIPAAASTFWRLALSSGFALWLVGCASAPEPTPAPATATSQIVLLEDWLAQARTAQHEGNREKARAAYRAAAQNYPTDKKPWLRLSEDYFHAQDYGNAVIAAQEALQRDGQDSMAQSILAMSGLRLTAGALTALRQDAVYPVGSRDEAVTVARALRDALGATALLPSAASTNPANRPRKPAALPAARPAAPAQPGSPFDKLK